jgi:hypothetical protein
MTPRTLIGLGLLAAALLPVQARAQRPQQSQEELIQRRAEKLAKPVFQKAPWMFDYDAARAKAKEEGKLLFTYFTRSYSP